MSNIFENITMSGLTFQLLLKLEALVTDFWIYHKKHKTSGNFKRCEAKDNKLERVFYPFPHQPSIRKKFYAETMDDYIKFVRNDRIR